MLFNSHLFIFLFLPVVMLGYYGLHCAHRHKAAHCWLFLSSLVFYAYYNPIYLLILLGSIFGNYAICRLLRPAESGVSGTENPDLAQSGAPGTDNSDLAQSGAPGRENLRRVIMILGVTANLAMLFFFKYFNFFLHNVNTVFRTDFVLPHIVMPLGISFFTFQQISIVVDTYRGEAGTYSFLEYGVFVSFFPQLVAGPIVLHQQMIPQLSEKERQRPDAERMAVGIRYVVMGLAKKCLLADALGGMVKLGYGSCFALSSPQAALVMLAYALQIYFDFSGYSDMAIGLGKLFGLDIPVNFQSPYKAVTIADFWKRWHMTMTSFFTKYLYIPLGGSRKGKWRTYGNVLIVFGLSGLWHGAAWTFVLWGLLHGAALTLHRMFRDKIERLPHILTGVVTFLFVNMAWVVFRAEGVAQAKAIFSRLLTGGLTSGSVRLSEAFSGGMLAYLGLTGAGIRCVALAVMFVYVAAGLLIALFAPSSHAIACRKGSFRGEGVCWGILAAAAIMTFTRVSEFLYFNF